MLYEINMEAFTVIEETQQRDSSGGWTKVQKNGLVFDGCLFENNSPTVIAAEKSVNKKSYKLFTEKGTGLKWHDIIKRAKDGMLFRVTSDSTDRRTPDFSNLGLERVNVERWDA